MFGLRAVITVAILVIAIFAHSESHERLVDQNPNGRKPTLCNRNPNKPSHLPPCPVIPESTATASAIEDDDSSEEQEQTTLFDNSIEDASADVSALERAHWCRFSNGTYVPYELEFYHTPCSLCRCTKSRAFRCEAIQCMPTYCADNSKPIRPKDQCCTRCASDPPANTCVYNGSTYGHGAIVKAIPGEMQCWCQLGNVECRQYIGTMFDSFNVMGQGMVLYMIIIMLFMFFFFGLLVCCGCTVLIYHYYQRNQQTFDEAYDQYINSAGWQPMEDEEEVVADSTAEEKRLEAERNQFYNNDQNVVPPSYDAYNITYVSGQEKK